MEKVSDVLNSPFDSYYFNVFVKDGEGEFVFPYTSSITEDVFLSFRKIEFIPYETDRVKLGIKKILRVSEIRDVGKPKNARTLLNAFASAVQEFHSGNVVNVVSFFYCDMSGDFGGSLFTVDYIVISDSVVSDEDNMFLLGLLNKDLVSINVDREFNGAEVKLIDGATYPWWLSFGGNGVTCGLMFSCYRINITFYGDPTEIVLGNINSEFKWKTQFSSQNVVVSSNTDEIVVSDNFGESARNVKHRRLHYCVCRCCVSQEQVVDPSMSSEFEYVCDTFSVVGNLMLFLNRMLLLDDSISVVLKNVVLKREVLFEGTPYLLSDMQRFKDISSSAFCGIFLNNVHSVDEGISQDIIRISSPQAFRSSVLLWNKNDLQGILYQGLPSFRVFSASESNFVQCHRLPNTSSVKIVVQRFNNSNYAFGEEELTNCTGVLIGELAVKRARDSLIENIF